MPTETPNEIITLLPQPLVSKPLNIEIMHFITRMMDMVLRPLKKEETVMINLLLTTIKVHKCRNILPALPIIHQVRGLKVEPRSIEVVHFGEVGYTAAEVTEFVDRRRTVLEPLGFVDGTVFLRWVVVV